MPKHSKRIVLLSVLLVFALGLALLLRRPNEPKYDGRYLSEWMSEFAKLTATHSELMAAQRAVRKIGTNGLPVFLNWLSYETPQWKMSLHSKLPDWVGQNRTIAGWLGDKDLVRAMLGKQGICILGTNAASAIPKLKLLMQNRTNVFQASLATEALSGIGSASLPVLQAAFADANQLNRRAILWNIHLLLLNGHANECEPILKAALEDPDIRVRTQATNLQEVTSINQLLRVNPW